MTRRLAPVAGLLAALLAPGLEAEEGAVAIEEVVVFGDAALAERLGTAGSWSALDGDQIQAIGATHINEAMNRIPGVWVVRGSGQEHLTAIRSAVLTGAGACGSFQYLEDGIPIRPAGFCNINNLFEVNSEQAASIEVWRGPASAVLGGNAQYGAINVLTDLPTSNALTLEGGPEDFYRVSGKFGARIGRHELGASIQGSSENGYRDATGHDQQKASLAHRTEVGDWEVFNTLSWTNLNQETGGFVSGFEAYKDNQLRKSNPNPEAYRDAWSLRAASHWTGERWRLVPYLRASDMEFLQHFLPGQPRERNDQTSGGLILGYNWEPLPSLTIDLGMQTELMAAHLDEYQEEPLTDSSPFNNAVRPQGTHYDYDVDSFLVAGYYDATFSFDERTRLVHSLRVEYLEYDYDNKSLDGNTRDDGSECGFGGCLYTRPADRSDSFTNLAPKLALSFQASEYSNYFVTLARGFRAPQATELYRLQNGQTVADLDSERIDALELGVRRASGNLLVDVALFAMDKKDSVYRDSAGFNVTGGRSDHRGIEIGIDWQLAPAWRLAIDASYGRHEYDFDVVAARGETFVSGRDVDTSPRWLGSAELLYDAGGRFNAALQWTMIDEYYLDAENEFRYSGHSLGNLRAGARLTDTLDLTLRLNNVTDRDIADRADYAFGNYRYFPGRGRELFAEIRYTPKESL